MDINNLNSEIKRIFFQILATGNKYITGIFGNCIVYKINDSIVNIACIKDLNYTPNNDFSKIFGINQQIVSGIAYTVLGTNYASSNLDNIKYNFCLNIEGVGSFDIVDLSDMEYAETMAIITNVIKDYKLNILESIDSVTENYLDND